MADDNLKVAVAPTEAANSASNPFYTVLSDGTNPLSVTGGVLDVNATVTLETAYVDDAAFSIGVDKVNAQGFLVDETTTDSVDEGVIGLARMTPNRIMLTSIEDASGNRLVLDASGFVTANINGTVTVTATDLDIRALDHVTIGDSVRIGDGVETLAINADGSINVSDNGSTLSVDDGGGSITVDAVQLDIDDLSAANDNVAISDGTDQLEVNSDGSINTVTEDASGTRVHDQDTSPATAQNSTDNHDYTVVNTNFHLKKVSIAGAGRMKAEVQTGPLASLVTKLVLFKERESTVDHEFTPALVVPSTSTGTVRIIRTQRSLGSLFMYSTIEGDDR